MISCIFYYKHRQQKKKIDKLCFITIKNFCINEHHQQSGKANHSMELEKIFINHTSDEGLKSTI